MRINENNYVDKAEHAIKSLANVAGGKDRKDKSKYNNKAMLTTSQIRNLLAMTADIYNQALLCQEDTLPPEICGRIEYLRVRFTYESGRDEKVRSFVAKAEILEILKEIKGSKRNYILFSRYMEALVAFHRQYRGKDQ